jgi:hypothetical protein
MIPFGPGVALPVAHRWPAPGSRGPSPQTLLLGPSPQNVPTAAMMQQHGGILRGPSPQSLSSSPLFGRPPVPPFMVLHPSVSPPPNRQQLPSIDSLALPDMPLSVSPLSMLPITPSNMRAPSPSMSAASQMSPNNGANAPAVPALPDLYRRGSATKKGCRCKSSHCLKLYVVMCFNCLTFLLRYCECFSGSSVCIPGKCKCKGCLNTPGNEEARQRAVHATLVRTPPTHRAAKVCHCLKSQCRKRYCECFQSGTQCSKNCKCQDCKNREDGPEAHDEEDGYSSADLAAAALAAPSRPGKRSSAGGAASRSRDSSPTPAGRGGRDDSYRGAPVSPGAVARSTSAKKRSRTADADSSE